MADRIFTVGYADHTPESLVAALSADGIAVVADVRANPVSRKKGFSKRLLSEALADAGIGYRSIRPLGIPTSDRNAAGSGSEGWSALLADYAKSLDDPSGRGEAAAELAEASKVSATAVLCLESDLEHCHRKPLAEWIAASTGLELHHI